MRLILHIPHSSGNIPLKDGYIVGDNIINAEIDKLTDWYTDDIFYSEKDITVKAEFSRVFCDVERYSDDTEEEMAQKFGMGVLYERTDDQTLMRQVTPELRELVLKNYYWPHHNRLNEEVYNQLERFSKAIIIDCHSFPEIPFNCSIDKNPERPDINIGTDSIHTPQKLLDETCNYFNSLGLKVWINKPYKGTIVPLDLYGNENVQSIMIEINRKLYMDKKSTSKSENYIEIKGMIDNYLTLIRNLANK